MMRRISLAAVGLALVGGQLVLAGPLAPGASAATILNQQFESTTEGWQIANGFGTLALAANGASNKALQGNSSGYLFVSKDLPPASFTTGTTYTLTAQVRRSSAAGTCTLGVKGSSITQTTRSFTNASFAPVSMTFTPSAASTWVQVYLEGQGATCFIDNVKVGSILNDTFESGTTDGWAVAATYGTATAVTPGTSANALKLSPLAAGGYSYGYGDIAAASLTAGVTYTVTAQVRKDSATGTCSLGFKGSAITDVKTAITSTSWNTVTLTGTPTGASSWAQVYLEGSSGGTCYVDNVVVSSGGTTTPPTSCASLPKSGGGTWTCTFADEFSGTALDTTKWSVITHAKQGYGWGNACFVDDGQHVQVSGGELRLIATSGAVSQCGAPLSNGSTSTAWKSGAVETRGKFSQKYGRFEMRAKFPRGKGMWPAFWMMPQTELYGGWPASGEIDIVEALGHQISTAYATLHYLTPAGVDANNGSPCSVSPNWSDAFHTYTLEWTTTTLSMYYDGALCRTFTGWQSNLGGTKPFDQPFFMILDLAVGGTWPGNPDGTTPFPGTVAVDYIRVWQ